MLGEDVLGILERDNNLGPHMVVGNSHSVEFLDGLEKHYEELRQKQILALEQALTKGSIRERDRFGYCLILL